MFVFLLISLLSLSLFLFLRGLKMLFFVLSAVIQQKRRRIFSNNLLIIVVIIMVTFYLLTVLQDICLRLATETPMTFAVVF